MKQVAENLRLLTQTPQQASGAEIVAAIRKLDEAVAANSDTWPAKFAHYMANRSYVKALDWIEQNDEV